MAKKRKSTVPIEKEIAALPRWARVAFAARCARRVQPLFQAFWPEAPPEHVAAVDTAITLAERAAAGSAGARAAYGAAREAGPGA